LRQAPIRVIDRIDDVEVFNPVVLRTYDTDHMTLQLPHGDLRPVPHQLAAVARMVAEPTAGLFHEVGAG
jgi:N12 class adenine-specific DNA methylase